MSKIGHTFHSSEFGDFNLVCHTCGAVGYEIDCDLTYTGDFIMNGLLYNNFKITNCTKWFCDCPQDRLALTRPDQPELTLPILQDAISRSE